MALPAKKCAQFLAGAETNGDAAIRELTGAAGSTQGSSTLLLVISNEVRDLDP
jgi:hypothetical protein